MIHQQFVTQPIDGVHYTSLFSAVLDRTTCSHLDIAVAYATSSGVKEIIPPLARMPGWDLVEKRWLIGIDWFRTEPAALVRLGELGHSAVRIHDGARVVRRQGCVPLLPFHPKTFIMRGNNSVSVICGSGNLSRNGMTAGHELGSLLMAVRPLRAGEKAVWDSCHSVVNWFDASWRSATPVSRILAHYERDYELADHLRKPTPTDDDTAPESVMRRRRAIGPEQLRKLRACRHLWIYSGNLHENLGKGRPGNQLMLSPMTRVFFGYAARDTEVDTRIGDVSIEYGSYRRDNCSLRFSNNSMDVLTLPVPESEGPASYDQEVLMFERLNVRAGGCYKLVLGTLQDVARWKRASTRIDGLFRMTSGREWGVF